MCASIRMKKNGCATPAVADALTVNGVMCDAHQCKQGTVNHGPLSHFSD
jgi:hypothetical protein